MKPRPWLCEQVGGRLGDVFDEDPRRWRMVAEAFLTVGLALEMATAFSPANFVLLAGAGNLSRAAGRGMTNPSFRIIQTHFAAANNIGEVAAKEEVSCLGHEASCPEHQVWKALLLSCGQVTSGARMFPAERMHHET